MGYYEDRLAEYQSKIKDLVSPERAVADVSQVRGRLGSVASSFGAGARDLVSGAEDVQERAGQRIGRRATELSDAYDLNRARTRMAQIYNIKLEEYMSAGNSLRASDAAARQAAVDAFTMENQAEAAEASRGVRREQQDIRSEFETAERNFQPDAGNPYEQALMRSLFGLATTAAAYKFINGKKVPVDTTKPANFNGTYAGDLRNAFNREDVRPYTLDFGTRGRVRYP